jgi:hypothetical protein
MRAVFSLFAAAFIGIGGLEADEKVHVVVHGQGWSDIGTIEHVTDTIVNNLNGNWQQSAGAQFTAEAQFGENWTGAFGFGGYQANSSLGTAGDARLVRSNLQNFITESRMTYYHGGRDESPFTLTFGNFSFNYNQDIKNLGAYLLRGPVYPGFLMGGFKDFRLDSTKANVLGIHAHHAIGNFSHDIVFANERELPPTGDWSVAYLAKYKVFGALEIGAGANFYRLLSNNKDLTTPSSEYYSHDSALANDGKQHHPYDFQYIEVNPVTHDTVFYTHRGIKVMGQFTFDLRSFFGFEEMGRNDLKLYGEAAILGVQNYGSVYKKIAERIPWTMGFNLPTWGLLDFCSLEVEWYGARYRNDLGKLGNFNTIGGGIAPYTVPDLASIPSPIPVSYLNYKNIDSSGDTSGVWTNGSGEKVVLPGTALDMLNMVQDNWKWSLYLEKTVLNHVRFIGQIANDHFRPRATAGPIEEVGGNAEAFSSLKDWYWMFRVGYYF